MKRKWISLLLVVAMLLSLASCGSPASKIEKVTDEFCDSFNDCDVEGMLDCVDPDTKDMVELTLSLTLGIAQAVTGFDLGIGMDEAYSMMRLARVLMPQYMEDFSEDDFPTLDMELGEIRFNDEEDRAVADVVMTLEASGQKEQESGRIYYICIDGDWYIANETFTQ